MHTTQVPHTARTYLEMREKNISSDVNACEGWDVLFMSWEGASPGGPKIFETSYIGGGLELGGVNGRLNKT